MAEFFASKDWLEAVDIVKTEVPLEIGRASCRERVCQYV